MKRRRITLLVLALFGFAVVVYFVGQKPSGKGGAVMTSLPSFSVVSEGGQPFADKDARDKVTVVHFWATWCPPCISEIPALAAFYGALQSNDRVRFVFVPYKDTLEYIKDFMKDRRISLPVHLDPDGRAATAFGVTGVPETYIFDRKGKLRQRFIGPADWNSAEMKNLFADLLK